jgi:hypothetical protein
MEITEGYRSELLVAAICSGCAFSLLCYFRRRRPFGGWLLFFLGQIFAIGLFSLDSSANWDFSRFKATPSMTMNRFDSTYVLVDTTLAIFLLGALSGLLTTRTWVWVDAIRWTLVTYIAVGLLRFWSIPVGFAAHAIRFGIIHFTLPVITIAYLMASTQARLVFRFGESTPAA